MQYRLVMFYSSLCFDVDGALVLVYWYFLVLIMEHFVIKFLPCAFTPTFERERDRARDRARDRERGRERQTERQRNREKERETMGPVGGDGGPHLFAEKRRIEKDKKGEFQIRDH